MKIREAIGVVFLVDETCHHLLVHTPALPNGIPIFVIYYRYGLMTQ